MVYDWQEQVIFLNDFVTGMENESYMEIYRMKKSSLLIKTISCEFFLSLLFFKLEAAFDPDLHT